MSYLVLRIPCAIFGRTEKKIEKKNDDGEWDEYSFYGMQ